MKIQNYSAEPLYELYNWIPYGLKAEEIIFFPDACPGKSPLPTGTVVKTYQHDWRRFAVSDCGCGMLLAKSRLSMNDFDKRAWDSVYNDLKKNKGKLGDLGSGNHFLDAIADYNDDSVYFLIHTGSRNESQLVDHLIDKPDEFDVTFESVCQWASDNRSAVLKSVEKYFGKTEVILDKNHNHFEIIDDYVIIRKGAAKLTPGELTVVPSNMVGDIVTIRGNEEVAKVYNSMCHGTGRTMSRSEAKKLSSSYDYDELRGKIYIPEPIKNESIKTDAPYCYRSLDDCLPLISDLVTVEQRFRPIAYIGQI
ncbi:RtcB family protein [Lewinella sp. IMCC34183]|uniref:RtcB family protein n=1 Tax=Lewinella sp. IMCC34183 TaxID=2248762 RepID=UPI000E21D440|nr:RtcB family protein [Lewinella sp. IMCC34183]